MRRVSDVLDCWFESGSMPFAQLHYPFENAEHFEAHSPADFICEYVGQTRGWFYTLHVLSTGLFDRPAFSNCIAHGVVLGNDGRKLSKRLKNYPDPEEFFARDGADTMRWYLLSSAVLRGQDVAIEEQAMSEPIRQVLNPIWNSWHFLALYGGIDGIVGRVRTDQPNVLDRYILAKTRALLDEVTAALDRYDLAGATASVTAFLDALTNWYVRRSRERFWRPAEPSAAADKADAYDTLHTVLVTLTKIVAPLLPLLAETVYRGLTGERSVHLTDWPAPAELPEDGALVEAMDLVREVCSAAHSVRKAERRRSRLPLARLTYAGPGASRLEPFAGLIADEVNVKAVELVEELGELAETTLAVVPAVLGPRLGPETQKVIGAARRGEWRRDASGVTVGGVALREGEYELRLVARDASSGRVLPGERGVVALDTALSPELEAEGTARDLVRIVQQARKDAGLKVTDKIALRLGVDDATARVLETYGEELARQTLASSLVVGKPAAGDPGHALGERGRVTVGIELAG